MARSRTRAKAGRPNLFGIESARDFYSLVVADFEDFMREPQSARRAIHCALSAYHLHDWVWGERLADYPQFRAMLGCGDSKGAFVAWCCRKTWLFAIVQEIATGSKHFRASNGLEAVRVGAQPFMFDTLGAGWDEGAWDGSKPAPAGQGYLLIDLGPEADVHRYQPAAHVLEAVVRFWRNFFRRYDAAAGPILSSGYHPGFDP
jgi:hypothetical protein